MRVSIAVLGESNGRPFFTGKKISIVRRGRERTKKEKNTDRARGKNVREPRGKKNKNKYYNSNRIPLLCNNMLVPCGGARTVIFVHRVRAGCLLPYMYVIIIHG